MSGWSQCGLGCKYPLKAAVHLPISRLVNKHIAMLGMPIKCWTDVGWIKISINFPVGNKNSLDNTMQVTETSLKKDNKGFLNTEKTTKLIHFHSIHKALRWGFECYGSGRESLHRNF